MICIVYFFFQDGFHEFDRHPACSPSRALLLVKGTGFAHSDPSVFFDHAEYNASSASFLVVASVPRRSNKPLQTFFCVVSHIWCIVARTFFLPTCRQTVLCTKNVLCEVSSRFGPLHFALFPPSVQHLLQLPHSGSMVVATCVPPVHQAHHCQIVFFRLMQWKRCSAYRSVILRLVALVAIFFDSDLLFRHFPVCLIKCLLEKGRHHHPKEGDKQHHPKEGGSAAPTHGTGRKEERKKQHDVKKII